MDTEQIIQRQESMEADRSTWESQWQDCADYAMPQNSQITRKKTAGQPQSDTFVTEAEDSNIGLAAGLYSYMFPADSKAFVLEVDDPDLAENDDVKTWLDTATTLIHKYLIKSNFRQAFFEFLKSLGCFGTACLYVEQGRRSALNFINHYMGQIYIATDGQYTIDTVHRKFEYKAHQAAKEFDSPGEKCAADAVDPKRMNEKYTFIHAVYPREKYDDTISDPLKAQWASVYINLTEKTKVQESGYRQFPFMVTRFDRDAGEEYGRSPTMKMLYDTKMLGQMKRTRTKGWDKAVDPPAVLPDDGSIWPVTTKPGGIIYKTPGSDDPFYLEFKGNLAGMNDAIQTTLEQIRRGYFLDLFDALIDRQNMTATEVMARVEQKIRLLTPIIGRLQSEFFNPLIHRIIYILHEQRNPKTKKRLLPKMPDALSESEYSIQYLGRLALALKTMESEGMVKTIEQFRAFLEAGLTDFLDNLDIDKAFRDTSRNNGSPSTWLIELKQREATRQKREQALQAQQMMEAVPELAKAYRHAGAKPEEGSLAEGLTGAA